MKSETITRNVTRRPDASNNYASWVYSFYYMLGWFTVPIEILTRRNFGSRWLTATNFFAGLLVLLLFTGSQYVLHWHATAFLQWLDVYEGATTPASYTRKEWLLAHSMFGFLALYLIFGLVHFYRMWWRRGINAPIHSFDDGTSWFEPLGKLFMFPINLLAAPFVYVGMIFIPRHERRVRAPWWLRNVTSFTNILIDPLALLVLAFLLQDVAGVWLCISALATFFYAIEKHRTRRTMKQDLSDNIIEAGILMGGTPKQPQQYRTKNKTWRGWFAKSQDPTETPHYGDVKSIIEDFHKDMREGRPKAEPHRPPSI
ncbi:hypothetical protein F9K33_08035 [bacterium]|nr:MAG: hypothetical protein F9K33_08035 [bacterium]